LARIAGVNIPTAKRVVIALTYIHGIGRNTAEKICQNISIPAEQRVNDLTDDVFRRMTRTTMDIADDSCGGRLVSLLEGGYNVDGTALAAAAHVETLLEGT